MECSRYPSHLCWCPSCPATGERRTLWRGSPAVWTTPALMPMTLWRRLSRVRTSLTAATMKVRQSFRLGDLVLIQHLCATVVTSRVDSLPLFRQQLETVCQQRWDHRPQRDAARHQVHCSQQVHSYTGSLYQPILFYLTVHVFLCFPEERLVFLSRWSSKLTEPHISASSASSTGCLWLCMYKYVQPCLQCVQAEIRIL